MNRKFTVFFEATCWICKQFWNRAIVRLNRKDLLKWPIRISPEIAELFIQPKQFTTLHFATRSQNYWSTTCSTAASYNNKQTACQHGSTSAIQPCLKFCCRYLGTSNSVPVLYVRGVILTIKRGEVKSQPIKCFIQPHIYFIFIQRPSLGLCRKRYCIWFDLVWMQEDVIMWSCIGH